MNEPRPQTSIGQVIGSIAATAAVLGGIAAWGISYGGLARDAQATAAAVTALQSRVDAKDRADIEIAKALTELRVDIGYLRRWVEDIKRTGERP